MPSARVDALFAHAAQRKILSIVALAYRTNAAVSSTRIARSSSSLPRYAARALQMRPMLGRQTLRYPCGSNVLRSNETS